MENDKRNNKNFIIIILIVVTIILIATIAFLGYKLCKKDTLNNNETKNNFNESTINVNQNPIATMEIKDYGTVKIELYPNVAPNTVNNFINLANNGFYDNLTFHRVIKNFMIQGGDKNGDGTGNPLLSDLNNTTPTTEDKEYAIKGEFEANGYNNSLEHTEGVISMARADYSAYGKTEEGYNSAGSQFFIITETSPNLDGSYASFGKVTEGMEIIHKIENISTNENNEPTEKVIINSIRVDTLGKEYDLPEILDCFDINQYVFDLQNGSGSQMSEEEFLEYYQHSTNYYDDSANENINDNTNQSTLNNNKMEKLGDVVNREFTKYKLNFKNNAKNAIKSNDPNYIVNYAGDDSVSMTPTIRYNGEVQYQYIFNFDMDMSTEYLLGAGGSAYPKALKDLEETIFIYDYEGYCYLRNGYDISKITLEYTLHYTADSQTSVDSIDLDYICIPKINVNGNTLNIELNQDCEMKRIYG